MGFTVYHTQQVRLPTEAERNLQMPCTNQLNREIQWKTKSVTTNKKEKKNYTKSPKMFPINIITFEVN